MFKSLISNSRRQLFLNLLIFNFVYAWSDSFSLAVLRPHFLQQGLSIKQMVLGTFFSFFSTVSIFFIFKKINSRVAWLLALMSLFLYVLLIVQIKNSGQFYLASLISGFIVPLFYVAYNIAHYQLTPKHHTGISSAIMFSVFPLVGLVAPLAAGWLASISYLYIWLISGFCFMMTMYLVKFQPNFSINFNLRSGFIAIKFTRWLLLLEGIWEIIIFAVIPIFSLHFIKSPLYYGAFMAYLSLVAIIANLVLGKLSDKLHNRLKFLYPVTLLMAVTTLAFPLVTANIIFWLILTGLIQFFSPLFWNFSTAYFVDLNPETQKVMPIRELILSFGRLIGLLLLVINFRFENQPTAIFYFLGAIMLLYPLVLVYNTRYAAKS